MDKSLACIAGDYRLAVPRDKKAECEACFIFVEQKTGRTAKDLRKSVSLTFKRYVNSGELPPNTEKSDRFSDGYPVYFTTISGMQVGFYLLESSLPPEVVIVAMSV